MVLNILTLFPEFSLLVCLLVMFFVNRYREAKTARTFFTISKIFVAIALLATVVFYNVHPFIGWLGNSSYTTMFKAVIYLLALPWFFLCCKWYLNKNRLTYEFYSLCVAALFTFSLLISAQNLALLSICVLVLVVLNYFLILQKENDEEQTKEIARNYLGFGIFFASLMLIGTFILYHNSGSLSYFDIATYLRKKPAAVEDLCAVAMIFAPLLFMLAAAPLHFWFAGVISISILPVSGFLTFIAVFAYVAALSSLMLHAFMPLLTLLKPVLIVFAFFSMFTGALSSNGEGNIRKLFAYSSIYHLGFVLLSIVAFDANSILSALVYLSVYALAMFGIYTVFLGLKTNGEYLKKISSLAGMSEVRPYVCAAFLVFMISLIGSPPMLGFLGRLSVINNLVVEGHWWMVIIVLSSLLLLANSYLQIIRSLYFEPRATTFDRIDKGIYICLFVNLVIVIISILNPGYLLRDAEKIIIRFLQ